MSRPTTRPDSDQPQARDPHAAGSCIFPNSIAIARGRRRAVMAVIACLTFGLGAGAAEPGLDTALENLRSLQQGQDLGVFHQIEAAIAHAHTDANTAKLLERRFVKLLQSDSTDLAKQYACRQLARFGTDAAVPAVAALLPSKRLTHMACYALEGIRTERARGALRTAATATTGRVRTGIVITLGRLADDQAVDLLRSLVGHTDPATQTAALVALGRIGTPGAATALSAFAATAPESLAGTVTDARLAAAEKLVERGDSATATAVYESLQQHPQTDIRAAALRGLITARPKDAVKMILAGLRATESWRRTVAGDCMLSLARDTDADIIAAAVAGFSVDGKITALSSLRGRSSKAVRAAALAALRDQDARVRIVALAVLVAAATSDDVASLAALAHTDSDKGVRDAALQTLCNMTAANTSQVICQHILADKPGTAELVRCAYQRRAAEFVPALLHAARTQRSATRLVALEALAVMADIDQLDALVALLIRAAPGAERESAGRAVWLVSQKIRDPQQRSKPLLRAMQAADSKARCALLPTVARFGGADALAAVHQAMRAADRVERDAGYRALANWPDASVCDELLDIARQAKEPTYRIWAIRAVARVAVLPSAMPADTAFRKLVDAMKLATRADDRQLILSRMGAIRTPAALQELQSHLNDPVLKSAAISAVFAVAKGLSQTHPDVAAQALKQIQQLTDDPAIVQQIPKVLRDIQARKKK